MGAQGAKDSKSGPRFSEKGGTKYDMTKIDEKPKTRTQKHATQNFQSKLSADAEEFPYSGGLPTTPPGIFKPGEQGVLFNVNGKYSGKKDEPWVNFLLQKERERLARSPDKMPAPKQPILLQTSEYLKLLKASDSAQGQKKGTNKPVPGGRSQGHISAAVDEIIQHRCKGGKDYNQEAALQSIAKLFESKAGMPGVSNDKMESAMPKPEDVDGPTSQDDIMVDKDNRDEDLADPVYWSEDERAPKCVRLASAHKLGHRPRHDPPRDYVMQDLDSDLDHQVAKLLLNAHRFTNRRKVFGKDQQLRYICNGLKEVGRAVKYGKAKCVVVAPDLEDLTSTGGVDARMHEILREAYKKDIPVVFALSRNRMGLAIGKQLKMSVLGLLETKGIQDHFDNMLSSAYQQRMSWVERELPPAGSKA